MGETGALFAALYRAADPEVVGRVDRLVREGADRELARINPLAFAAANQLGEEAAIAAFLHASKLGLFDMAWNVLCPGCGGVLDSGATLKTIKRDAYHCALCAAGYEPTLDEIIEVTFTVSPRTRAIPAHHPDTLPPLDYYRQVFFSSGVDLPQDFERRYSDIILEMVELAPGERAFLSLRLPPEYVIVFDPVTHSAQFIEVTGEPTSERQNLSLIIGQGQASSEAITLRPGALRLTLENHAGRRIIPNVVIAGHELHEILGHRRPFLTGKRLLTHQTFRDLYRADTLDINQRLRITSLTFLFTDLRGSTNLYERVGDLAAFDLVRAHFDVLHDIVADEAGAVVKTIGDAVMATFSASEHAVAAALRMRQAMRRLNEERGREDLLLKIGIHQGPCLAVVLNDRQDFFGQTVNIASRVQSLADPQTILVTQAVLSSPRATEIMAEEGVASVVRTADLRGISREIKVFALS